MSKKNIAVIFGGASSEHEVSRKSAATIISNIPKDRYNVLVLGITKQGKWFLYPGSVKNIIDGSWEKCPDNKAAFPSADPELGGILVVDSGSYGVVKLDAAIPVLHGRNGEDGTIQGLFTLANIPFVGCDVLASSMCMDKVVSNIMFEYAGLDQAKFTWFYFDEYLKDEKYYCDLIENRLGGYPVFIKPANAGSSVGISKVYSRSAITGAIVKASREDTKILVEQSIDGREIECAVMGNRDLMASVVGEIKPCNDFYDYDAKYVDSDSDLIIPADIGDELSEKVRNSAIKAYKTMGCKGLSRIDFFLEKDSNRVLINEINTFPGFTGISMYPRLMDKSGFNLPDLIDNLILLAIGDNNI